MTARVARKVLRQFRGGRPYSRAVSHALGRYAQWCRRHFANELGWASKLNRKWAWQLPELHQPPRKGGR